MLGARKIIILAYSNSFKETTEGGINTFSEKHDHTAYHPRAIGLQKEKIITNCFDVFEWKAIDIPRFRRNNSKSSDKLFKTL
jgi:hypothetical protein